MIRVCGSKDYLLHSVVRDPTCTWHLKCSCKQCSRCPKALIDYMNFTCWDLNWSFQINALTYQTIIAIKKLMLLKNFNAATKITICK